ncbi:Protein of unknown function [Pyronema omphalodes CBS 100304]|uniref:Uncharacterized protein n=1 Tax=Pyronema omphalodes (strain CBS 100304) TaxID=1076935 RepID=U4KWJ3_PYROM|nr:Protein of unknown function [Pyronema omphalodes CBS 100304]
MWSGLGGYATCACGCGGARPGLQPTSGRCLASRCPRRSARRTSRPSDSLREGPERPWPPLLLRRQLQKDASGQRSQAPLAPLVAPTTMTSILL